MKVWTYVQIKTKLSQKENEVYYIGVDSYKKLPYIVLKNEDNEVE